MEGQRPSLRSPSERMETIEAEIHGKGRRPDGTCWSTEMPAGRAREWRVRIPRRQAEA